MHEVGLCWQSLCCCPVSLVVSITLMPLMSPPWKACMLLHPFGAASDAVHLELSGACIHAALASIASYVRW